MRKLATAIVAFIFCTAGAVSAGGMEFTEVVKENAGLIVFLSTTIGGGLIWAAKQYFENMKTELHNALQKADKNEAQAEQAGNKLFQRELDAVKGTLMAISDRITRFEGEQISCQRNLPLSFVTRTEFERFQTQTREDNMSFQNRMETMIKDFKNELKSDMQMQLERLIDAIEGVGKK